MKLKVDFHIHVKGDPRDKLIRHTAFDVINKAKKNNFDVISITCHRKILFNQEMKEYAESKGILLIPGVELEINSAHVLLINPPLSDLSWIKNFEELRSFRKNTNSLAIIAPHPFFPGRECLNSRFFEFQDLFDAVEYNGVYLKGINYNNNLKKFLKDRRFPIVGSSDTHFLSQFGLTYTLLEAEKNIPSILEAIRKNNIEIVTRPLGIRDNGLLTIGMFFISGMIKKCSILLKRIIK